MDRGSSDDKFLSDMLFGDSAEKHKLSSSQAVPDILPDDLLNKSPDLINVHETKMDGVDDDDIFGFLEGGTENVSSNAWPSKRRHSSHSSQISTVSVLVMAVISLYQTDVLIQHICKN